MIYNPKNNQTHYQSNNRLKRPIELNQSSKSLHLANNKTTFKTSGNKNSLINNNSKQNIFKSELSSIPSFNTETKNYKRPNLGSSIKQKIVFNKEIIEKSLNLMKQIKVNLALSPTNMKKNIPSFIKKNSLNTNNTSKFLCQSFQNPKSQQNPKSHEQSQQIKILDECQEKHSKSYIYRQKEPQAQYLVLKIKDKVQIFLTLKYIDEGAFGKIMLVMHVSTGFIMCLKIYAKTTLNQDSFKQLARQIKIQSCMNHPNIVALYGFSSDDENVYLFMQPCLGSNAFKKLNKKPISEKQAKKYIKQVSSALSYLHKMEIIHRDIKAQNVVFHQNVAKICDFGWAVQLSEYRSTQCGTPVYLAPQVLKCQNYDSKVDVWSMGVLTYELLFGKNPFRIKNMDDLQNIIENDVQFQNHMELTGKAKEFIQHCLAKVSSQRLNIQQCLQHQFLASETIPLRSPTHKK